MIKLNNLKILIVFVFASLSCLAARHPPKSLKIARVDCPQLIPDNVVLTPSTCGGKDGSITGMKGSGTGTLHYTWFNNVTKQVAGNDADLINVPTGTYHVQLKDDSKCLAAVSGDFFVDEKNKVVIDNAKTVITGASCNGSNGSVTNIIALNATRFSWIDSKNKIIASTADLENVAAGNYTLTATNNSGCTASATYQITSTADFPSVIKIDTTLAYCGGTGSFKLTFKLDKPNSIYLYTLVNNDNNKAIQNGGLIPNPAFQGNAVILFASLLPDIGYTLYILNTDNCQTAYNLKLTSALYKIDDEHIVNHSDYCGQSIGTIIGLKVLGRQPGPPAPNEYAWRDANGKVISGLLFLAGVPAGKYTFTATDPAGCTDSKEYIIRDSTTIANPPQVNDIKLCLPGKTFLNVIKPDTGGFNLYDSTETLVTSNKFGTFPVSVKKTSIYYVTHTNGTCESPKTKVTIFVSLPGVEIPNTFTPNNDGINDYWVITGLENYAAAQVSIFTRDGQPVFHSIGYGRPFDGRMGNKQLPAGVYYYTIDTKKLDCAGLISGSLTLIR